MLHIWKTVSMDKLLALLFFFISIPAYADYVGGVTPKKIYGNGLIRFGMDTPPANTCEYFGRHFEFDATTEGGKVLMSMLLAAHLSKQKLDIWYTPSSAPGDTHDENCVPNQTMAVITQLGFAE